VRSRACASLGVSGNRHRPATACTPAGRSSIVVTRRDARHRRPWVDGYVLGDAMPPKAKTAGRTAAATAVATKTATKSVAKTVVAKTAAIGPVPAQGRATAPVRATAPRAPKRNVANPNPHPQRKEIARYMLSRGLDAQTL